MTDERKNTDSVVVKLGPRIFRGTWHVVGERVEVRSDIGVDSAPLGLLKSAPATVAREKLTEMARRFSRPEANKPARPRFDIRDVLR